MMQKQATWLPTAVSSAHVKLTKLTKHVNAISSTHKASLTLS